LNNRKDMVKDNENDVWVGWDIYIRNYRWTTGRVDRVRTQKHHTAQPAVDPFQPNFKVSYIYVWKFDPVPQHIYYLPSPLHST